MDSEAEWSCGMGTLAVGADSTCVETGSVTSLSEHPFSPRWNKDKHPCLALGCILKEIICMDVQCERWIFLWQWQGSGHAYPKIGHLGILDISTWKNLRNGLCRQDFSDLSLKQVIKPSCETCSPNTLRKEHRYLWRKRDTGRNLNQQALLSFPQFTTLSSYPSSHHLSTTSILHPI